jgi:Tol biopolymer transport system component
MTLDTRARRAAQGIRQAVEVMEMSTSTREPRVVERFDRFRDRKQRNRRVGALLVAAMLAIAAIVAVTNELERREKVPVTPPAQNGRIVFGEKQRPGPHFRVYTMNPDGTDVRALSVSGYVTGPDGSPQPITGSTPVKGECMSWAPDGSKILIDRQSLGGLAVGSGLATIDPDGTGYTELSQQEIGCGALSPDATRFVFPAGPRVDDTSSGLGNGIYAARASDGGDLVRLTNFAGMFASYSPDGTQVMFTPMHDRASTLSHHASGLWVVNADGTGLHLIAHIYAIRPSWSPDGRWILWETASDGAAVYVVHPDGTGLRRITLESVPRLRHVIYPSWSPDGTRFVFVGILAGSGRENLFTARIDGTDVEQITHTHGISYLSPDWGTNAG